MLHPARMSNPAAAALVAEMAAELYNALDGCIAAHVQQDMTDTRAWVAQPYAGGQELHMLLCRPPACKLTSKA